MRIVIAPNAFKGSLSALDAAEAIAEGVRIVVADADLVLVPIADGGDGTVDALVAATHGERRTLRVRGPLGDPVDAGYGVIDTGSTAVIEMAKAAGLALVPPAKRDPRITTTYGVGELLQHAYDAGARRFMVGIGGSATNDGGAGMAQALGYYLLDGNGHELPPGGLALQKLARIHTGGVHADWQQAEVDVACDVTNPLTGPSGASAVYGPQKGATPDDLGEVPERRIQFGHHLRRGPFLGSIDRTGPAGPRERVGDIAGDIDLGLLPVGVHAARMDTSQFLQGQAARGQLVSVAVEKMVTKRLRHAGAPVVGGAAPDAHDKVTRFSVVGVLQQFANAVRRRHAWIAPVRRHQRQPGRLRHFDHSGFAVVDHAIVGVDWMRERPAYPQRPTLTV